MKSHVLYTIFATSLAAITLSYIYRRKRLQHPPKNPKWKFIGIVEEIAIYPVTSAASNLLNEVRCKTDGVYLEDLKDRSLILYDESGKSANAGAYPKMLSITTEVQNKSTLILKAPHVEELIINLDLLKIKKPIIKKNQGIKLHLVEGEQEQHIWFSTVILNKSYGLKLFLNVKTELEYNLMGEDKSNFIPVMVINNVSINDLNSRLSDENQVHHLQFRGNVIIKSAGNVKPYDEDNWTWLRFGAEKGNEENNCILRYHAPCLRCIIPNVNIQTHKINPSCEPLKTLKKYRLIHNSKEPTMGAYYKVYQEGILKLKDPVYAIVA